MLSPRDSARLRSPSSQRPYNPASVVDLIFSEHRVIADDVIKCLVEPKVAIVVSAWREFAR
jgi:hypothetical protein